MLEKCCERSDAIPQFITAVMIGFLGQSFSAWRMMTTEDLSWWPQIFMLTKLMDKWMVHQIHDWLVVDLPLLSDDIPNIYNGKYPLVNVYIAIEHGHRNIEFYHENSMVNLSSSFFVNVYQFTRLGHPFMFQSLTTDQLLPMSPRNNIPQIHQRLKRLKSKSVEHGWLLVAFRLALWKMMKWVRQLGWWHSQLNGKKHGNQTTNQC